jgi:hypothetical protein
MQEVNIKEKQMAKKFKLSVLPERLQDLIKDQRENSGDHGSVYKYMPDPDDIFTYSKKEKTITQDEDIDPSDFPEGYVDDCKYAITYLTENGWNYRQMYDETVIVEMI